jgi:hypothetical protein
MSGRNAWVHGEVAITHRYGPIHQQCPLHEGRTLRQRSARREVLATVVQFPDGRARTRSSASLPSTAVLLRLSKRRLPGRTEPTTIAGAVALFRYAASKQEMTHMRGVALHDPGVLAEALAKIGEAQL